jgi:hypothetical protein
MSGRLIGPVVGADGVTAIAWTNDEDFDEATIRAVATESGLPPELTAAVLAELENDET